MHRVSLIFASTLVLALALAACSEPKTTETPEPAVTKTAVTETHGSDGALPQLVYYQINEH